MTKRNHGRTGLDPELQAVLLRLGLAAFDRLLAAHPAGEPLPAGEIAALVRLLKQASEGGEPA